MDSNDPKFLEEFLSNYPSTKRIANAVVNHWPEHRRFVTKSFQVRTQACMDTTELLASAALTLAGDRISQIAENYHWTCDRLRNEELYFHRTGHYRLSTFVDANREVYSNEAYMKQYVDGLLLSQVLWSNHAESCNFYFRTIPQFINQEANLLEIGPGHGLMLYLALVNFKLGSATAWDLSPVSIEQTQRAVAKLGFNNAKFAVRDLLTLQSCTERFDLVVLSEVLEHLEDPMSAVRAARHVLTEGGYIFVNVPINSPSPDHIYLMRSLQDARDLLIKNGFRIIAESAFATQGTDLSRALKIQVSISVCMLATPT